MTTYATVVLDSGLFLTARPDSGKWEVGFFESKDSIPSIRVYYDGKELPVSPALKTPTGRAVLEVQLVEGKTVKKGISVDSSLIDYGLTWDKLYDDLYKKGETIEIDRTKLDCTIEFQAGYFRASMIKTRRFKQEPPPGEKWTDPVAHNVVVHYAMNDAEELRLVEGGNTIWTSRGHPGSASLIELEIISDHSTAPQFFRNCLMHKGSQYAGPFWLPNQGDPTPILPPGEK
jgi:hypothetical protein